VLSTIGKIDALLAGITLGDIERMPTEHRQRLAQAFRRIADLADPPKKQGAPSGGVLASLRNGERSG
jgi:hypothetical protein